MEKQEIAALLINGGLVRILKVGKTLPTMVRILKDHSAPAGLRLAFEQVMGAPVGGLIPSYSFVNGKLTKPSRQEVAQFLADSFGLDQGQAMRVVAEAHAERDEVGASF